MTDKKYTDEEIIKAFQTCSEPDSDCKDCPLYCDYPLCGWRKYILDIINRQKAEIEELKNYVNRCKSGKEYWVKCLLEKPNEALKEFAERIKMSIKANVVETLCNDVKGVYNAEYIIDDIDNLLKEMVGEEE